VRLEEVRLGLEEDIRHTVARVGESGDNRHTVAVEESVVHSRYKRVVEREALEVDNRHTVVAAGIAAEDILEAGHSSAAAELHSSLHDEAGHLGNSVLDSRTWCCVAMCRGQHAQGGRAGVWWKVLQVSLRYVECMVSIWLV
jgi:hypothetical protein